LRHLAAIFLDNPAPIEAARAGVLRMLPTIYR